MLGEYRKIKFIRRAQPSVMLQPFIVDSKDTKNVLYICSYIAIC